MVGSNTSPEIIQDVNGKFTTVHKKNTSDIPAAQAQRLSSVGVPRSSEPKSISDAVSRAVEGSTIRLRVDAIENIASDIEFKDSIAAYKPETELYNRVLRHIGADDESHLLANKIMRSLRLGANIDYKQANKAAARIAARAHYDGVEAVKVQEDIEEALSQKPGGKYDLSSRYVAAINSVFDTTHGLNSYVSEERWSEALEKSRITVIQAFKSLGNIREIPQNRR